MGFDAPQEKPKQESALAEFGDSLMNSAIQNPLNSLSQIGSAIIRHDLPEMHYFDPAQPTDGTGKLAATAGNAIGMIVPFLAAKKIVGVGEMKLGITAGTSMLGVGAEQAAIGGVMGLGLTPSNDGIVGRLKNGAIDAGTFGVMGAAGAKLNSSFGNTQELPLTSRIARSSLIGFGSGIAGGLSNAELNAILNQNKLLASGQDFRNEAISFGLLGGIMGGAEAFTHGKTITKPTELETRFPAYAPEVLETGRSTVMQELAQVKASSLDERTVSVLDKLNESNLSDTQKQRVLGAMAAVRENHVSYRTNGVLDGDQEKNWIHTQGEFGRVLDSASDMKLTPAQTEDALLGSMFSDAIKTKSNFMVHHLDGATAAETFLRHYTDSEFTPERVSGIVQAIREHQIGPPGFMAMIYSGNIRSDINMERGQEFGSLRKTPKILRTEAQQERFEQLSQSSEAFDERAKQLANMPAGTNFDAQRAALQARQMNGRFVTDEEANAISSIAQKISDPLNAPRVDLPGGGKAVQMTDLEHQLLARTGNRHWYVPDASTPWHGSSRALINGDSIDNYATPGGFSKLLGLNGPETDIFFRHATIDDSLKTPRASFAQAYKIMTPEGRQLADLEMWNTDAAIERAKLRTEAWLKSELGVPADQELPVVPYWNADLKYPDRGELESDYWRVHKIAPEDRSADEYRFWSNHRYDGLNPQEVHDFQFAKQIRDHMVDELRREQRVDGSLPPDYQQVMHPGAKH